ncbi:MAG: acyl-CoA thioesterase [Acidobacteria bacterium]|nr:acyl-CoA thioesterase [Acidobacteriota bacterium]
MPACGQRRRPAGRRPASSRVVMTSVVLPTDTNTRGTIFGGRILEMIDKAGAISAIRHCRSAVVTASIDQVHFLSPVHQGDIVSLEASVNQVFRSSLEVGVKVYSEEASSGRRCHTTTAYVTMVALDENGEPKAMPPLKLSTPGERARARAAEHRRRWRLKNRSHARS